MDPRHPGWRSLILSFYETAAAQPQHDGVIVDMVDAYPFCDGGCSGGVAAVRAERPDFVNNSSGQHRIRCWSSAFARGPGRPESIIGVYCILNKEMHSRPGRTTIVGQKWRELIHGEVNCRIAEKWAEYYFNYNHY